MKPPDTPSIARRPLRHLIALSGLAALAVLLLPALAFAVPQTAEPVMEAEPEVVLEGDDLAPTGLYDAPVIEEEDLPPEGSLNDEGELLIHPVRDNDPNRLLDRPSLLDDIDNEEPVVLEVELEESSDLEAELNALAGTDAPDLYYEADSYAAPSTPSTVDRLPATASPLPLLLAVGLLALSFALVMAIARFRRDDRHRALSRSIVTHEIDRRLHGAD